MTQYDQNGVLIQNQPNPQNGGDSGQGAQATPEEVQEYTWRDKSFKMTPSAWQEFQNMERGINDTNKKIAELKKGGQPAAPAANPSANRNVDVNDPVVKGAIAELKQLGGFMTQDEFNQALDEKLAQKDGERVAERELSDLIGAGDSEAKEVGYDALKTSDDEKAMMLDLIKNHGLHPQMAYDAVKGTAKANAKAIKASKFQPVYNNSAPGTVRSKPTVEQGGYKPMTKDNLVENTKNFFRARGFIN